MTREEIENQGWEFIETNKIRAWYKKWNPEQEKDRNWYKYKMYYGYLVHDPGMNWLKINVDFSGGQEVDDCDTLFEGECQDLDTYKAICKLIHFNIL